MAKKLLTTQYEFNALNKSITLIGNIAKERLLLITNLETNDIIYNFGDPDAGVTNVIYIPSQNKTQIALKYDTSDMSDIDTLQIFIEQEETEFAPGQTFLDPVSKIRVSNPQNLIDTDFEYGLQATRWETTKIVNNIPTFYTKNANAPLIIKSVTIAANSKQVSVITDFAHELIPGSPFEISGLSLNRFEGSYLVKNVINSTTFNYEGAVSATASQAQTPHIETAFTAINPGAFYTGSNISINKIDTNGANPSTLTVTTPFPHGFKLNNEFYFLNTVAFSKTNFNALSDVVVTNTISETKTILSTTNGSDTTNYLAKTLVITNWISANIKYFQSTTVKFAPIATTLSAAVAVGQNTNTITVSSKTSIRAGQIITSTDTNIGPNGKNLVTLVGITTNIITLKYNIGPGSIASGTSVTFSDDTIDITHGLTTDTLNFSHLLVQQSNTAPNGLVDNTTYIAHTVTANQLRFYLETATGRKTINGNYKEIAAASGTASNTINLSDDASLGNSFNLTSNSMVLNDGIVYNVNPFSFTTSTAGVITTIIPESQTGLTTQKTITIPTHGFRTGQKVLYKVTTGSTPIGGLNTNQLYYLQNAGANNVRFFTDYRLISTSTTSTSNGYVDTDTNIIRWDNHGFANNDIVAYNVLKSAASPAGNGYTAIGGITPNTTILYWIRVVGVNTFSIHTANTLTNTNIVDLTSVGSAGANVHLFLRGVVNLTSAGTTTSNAHQFKPSASLQLDPENFYWVRDISTSGTNRFRLAATPEGPAIVLHFTGRTGSTHQFTRGLNTLTSEVLLQNHGFIQDDVVILDTNSLIQTVYPGGRLTYGKAYFVQYIDANRFQLRNGLTSTIPVSVLESSYGFTTTTSTTDGFTLSKANRVDITGTGSTVYGPNHILFGLNRLQVSKGNTTTGIYSKDTIHTYQQHGLLNNESFVLLGSGTTSTGLDKSSNNYNPSGYNVYVAAGVSGGNIFSMTPNAFASSSTDVGGYLNPLYACEVTLPTLADSVYSLAHGYANNTYIKYTNTETGAAVIGGLTNNNYYYVVSPTTNNFKLALIPSGTAINLTSFGAQNHNFILTSTNVTRDTIILPAAFATGTRLVYSPGSGNNPIQRQLAGSSDTEIGNLISTFYTLINKGNAGTGLTRYRITQNGDSYNLTSLSFIAGGTTFTAIFTASSSGQTPQNLQTHDTVEIIGAPAASSWFNDIFTVNSVGNITTVNGLSTATITLNVPEYKDKLVTISATTATAKEFINLTSTGTGTQSFNTESGVDGVYKTNTSTIDSALTFGVSSPVQINSTSKSFGTTDITTLSGSISLPDHRFTDGTAVTYTAGTTSVGGLANATIYYIIVINKDVIKLAATPENAQGLNAGQGIGKRIAIDLTTTGNGTHLFTTSSVYGEKPSNDASINAGTATLNTGQSFVSGVSTKFLTLFSPGEKFRVYKDSKLYEYEIDSVKSDTRIKLKTSVPLNYGAQGDLGNEAPTNEVTFINVPFAIQTKIYPKSDAIAVHRPFDGGVDMIAGSQPRTTIVRQTKKYFRYQSGKGIQISLATNFNPPFDVDSLGWENATGTVLVNTRRPHNFSTTNFSNIKIRIDDAEVTSGYNPYNGTFNVNSIVDEFQYRYKPAGYSFTSNLTVDSNVIENVSLEVFEEIQINGVLIGTQLPLQTLANGTIANTIVNDIDVIAGKIYLGSSINRNISGISSNYIQMPTTPSNPFANGNLVEFDRTTNNIIKGVSYYVVNSTTSGFNIANISGGAAITLLNINTINLETVTSIASNVISISGTNDFLDNDLIVFNDTSSNIIVGQKYIVRDRTTSSFKLSEGKIISYSRTGGGTFSGEANKIYFGVVGKNSQATVSGASWISSGTSNVATLTYIGSYIFPIGSTILVQKVLPTGYNGSYIVTASSANSVSYAAYNNPGVFVSSGIVTNPSTGVDASFTIARDSTGAIPSAVTKTNTTGNFAEDVLNVTSSANIIVGAGVSGGNISFGTTVTAISGTAITISTPLLGNVFGSVTFNPVSLSDVGSYYNVGDVITIDAADIGNSGGTDLAITISTIDTYQLADSVNPVGLIASPVPIVVSPKFSALSTQTDATISIIKTPSTTIARGFPKYNVTKYTDAGIRCGMFDNQNGFFFEFDGTNINCVRRSSTQQIAGICRTTKKSRRLEGTETRFNTQLSSGNSIVIRGQTYKIIYIENDTTLYFQPEYKGESLSSIVVTKIIDTKVPQSQWNIDTCDGSGKFGYLIDLSKIQMCYADYSWYGAGKIRFGFKDQHGEVKYIHEFIHNNDFTEAYFRSGNLPVRYEAYTENAPDFSPAIFHWGTSVIMDGKFDDDKAYLFTGDSKFLTFTNGGNNTVSSADIVSSPPLPNGVQRVIELDQSSDFIKVTNGSLISGGTGLAANTVIVSSYRVGSNLRLITSPQPSGSATNQTYTIGDSSILLYNLISITSGNGIPLVSIRLAPSVDNGLTGPVGFRDIINRMQMNMVSAGIITSQDLECKLVLNGILSNDDFVSLRPPSLAQLYKHEVGDTVTGGDVVFSFRANGSPTARSTNSTTIDLFDLTTLGNSILGGDGVFPNGPDVLTLTINPVEPSVISGSNPLNVSTRISWKESQA